MERSSHRKELDDAAWDLLSLLGREARKLRVKREKRESPRRLPFPVAHEHVEPPLTRSQAAQRLAELREQFFPKNGAA